MSAHFVNGIDASSGDYLVPPVEERLAEMRPEEPGAPGDDDPARARRSRGLAHALPRPS